MDYKQRKELEKKVHENLFTNLMLLSHIYPITKELRMLLRRDMFVKNNKAAFYEVTHYLLNILNPELTKQKLTSWPVLDSERERKFRNELVSYIHELNSLYEKACIPSCQPSSLIAPGGFNFANFMFKISQLVVYEHLKKSSVDMLHCPSSQRNTPAVSEAQLKHLRRATKLIENEISTMLHNFDVEHLELIEKAEQLKRDLIKLEKDIQSSKIELEETQKEFVSKYPMYSSIAVLEQKLVCVKDKLQKVVELDNSFNFCEDLLNYLKGSNLKLEHREDDFIVPDEIQHVIKNKQELNLVEYFEGLIVLLELKALEGSSLTRSSVEHITSMASTLSVEYQSVLNQSEEQNKRISKLLEMLEKKLNDTPINTGKNLLCPLTSSTSSLEPRKMGERS